MSQSNDDKPLDAIYNAWRNGRQIVPFIGAGVSGAAGFPMIRRLTKYLAKALFAIKYDLYKARYPESAVAGTKPGIPNYSKHPCKFVGDFGWPHPGQLNARLSQLPQSIVQSLRDENRNAKGKIPGPVWPENFGVPDSLAKSMLLKRLLESEPTVHLHQGNDLNGSWNDLLDSLTEGKADLIDTLFFSLGQGRSPARAHIFTAHLIRLIGIRLLLTLNFDTLHESALDRLGIPYRTFDVHRLAILPNPWLVRQQFSIVKLHGSSYGLRTGSDLNRALELSSEGQTISEYLPRDALLLVYGFGGDERRIMQALNVIAGNYESKARPRILWLTPNSTTSTYLSELQADHRDKIRICRIEDINAFLAGLYFRIAGSFPKGPAKYDALNWRPPIDSESQSAKSADKPESEVILVDDLGSPEKAPTSWPSLAARQIARHYEDTDTLWIDLENHHTVDGIVQDLLDQIHQLDPETRRLAPFIDQKEVMEVVASRVRGALIKGRYIVVFDSLESFCRNRLVHHGVRLEWGEANQQIEHLQAFRKFFSLLVGQIGKPPLKGCTFVITLTKPAARHATGADLESDRIVQKIRNELEEFAKSYHADNTTPLFSRRMERISPRQGWTFPSDDRMQRYKAAKDRFDEFLTRKSAGNAAIPLCGGLCDSVASMVGDKEAEEASRMTFLAILCCARRARPLPLIRSFIAWWLFDPHYSAGKGAAFDKISEKLDKQLKQLENEGFISILEGEVVWIPREIQELGYGKITEGFSQSELRGAAQPADRIAQASILAAWHLYYSRSYFVDIYLPSKDEQAFFEFIYHRMSALWYLHILHGRLSSAAGLSEVESRLRAFFNDKERKAAVREFSSMKDINKSPSFGCLLKTLGVFTFICADGAGNKAPSELKQSIERLIELASETFETAFEREQEQIGATTNVSTWLGWIDSIIRELEKNPQFKSIKKLYRDLVFRLRMLKAKLSRSNLNFPLAMEAARSAADPGADPSHRAKRIENQFEQVRSGQAPDARHGDSIPSLEDIRKAAAELKREKPFPENLQLCNKIEFYRIERDLRAVPMWRPEVIFMENGFDLRGRWKPKKLCQVERLAVGLDAELRLESRDLGDEYGQNRARAATLRARSLYLRGEFHEAYRQLAFARRMLSDNKGANRFSAAIIDLLESELKWISARWHLSEKPEDMEGQPRDIVVASLRKLESATMNLDLAAASLAPLMHRRATWIRLHVGRSRICHDRILFQAQEFLKKKPDERSEGDGFLLLERLVLDGLRSLRAALDLMPLATTGSQPLLERDLALGLFCSLFRASFMYSAFIAPSGPQAANAWADKWGDWCESAEFYSTGNKNDLAGVSEKIYNEIFGNYIDPYLNQEDANLHFVKRLIIFSAAELTPDSRNQLISLFCK